MTEKSRKFGLLFVMQMTIKSFSQKYFYIRNTFLAFFHFSLLHLGLNCHAISCKKKHKLRFLCPTVDYLLHLEGLSVGAYLHSAHKAFKCWRSFYNMPERQYHERKRKKCHHLNPDLLHWEHTHSILYMET